MLYINLTVKRINKLRSQPHFVVGYNEYVYVVILFLLKTNHLQHFDHVIANTVHITQLIS